MASNAIAKKMKNRNVKIKSETRQKRKQTVLTNCSNQTFNGTDF